MKDSFGTYLVLIAVTQNYVHVPYHFPDKTEILSKHT